MNDHGDELRSVESYNPVTKEWCQLADMTFPRAYMGVAVLQDDIYVVGGWNDDDKSLASIERYDVKRVSLTLPQYAF